MLNCQGVKQWESVTWGTSDCRPCGITYVREAGKHFIEPLSRTWINFLLVHKKFLSRVDKGFIIIIALAWIMIINDAWVYFVYKICNLQLKPHIICSFTAFSSVADLKIYHLFSKCIPVKLFFCFTVPGKVKNKKYLKDFNRTGLVPSWYRIMMLQICYDKSCNHFSMCSCFTTQEPNQTPLIMSSTSSWFDFNEITSEIPDLVFSLNSHWKCLHDFLLWCHMQEMDVLN